MIMVDAYRTNVDEARRALRAAQARFERIKDAGGIYHGKLALKSGSEYNGWLVRNRDADEAFTERVRAESELMHWSRLLSDATSLPVAPPEKAGRAEITEEEKRAFVEKWKGELDARAESNVAPAPVAEPDARLPPEKDDDF